MAQSNDPQNVSDSVWYYEDGRKLDFVVRTGDFGQSDGVNTIQFAVPLRMLEESLARMKKRKRVKR